MEAARPDTEGQDKSTSQVSTPKYRVHLRFTAWYFHSPVTETASSNASNPLPAARNGGILITAKLIYKEGKKKKQKGIAYKYY